MKLIAQVEGETRQETTDKHRLSRLKNRTATKRQSKNILSQLSPKKMSNINMYCMDKNAMSALWMAEHKLQLSTIFSQDNKLIMTDRCPQHLVPLWITAHMGLQPHMIP